MITTLQNQARPVYGATDAKLLAMSHAMQTLEGIRWLNENFGSLETETQPIKNRRFKDILQTLTSHRAFTIFRLCKIVYDVIFP